MDGTMRLEGAALGSCGQLAGRIAFGVVAQNPAVTLLIMARVLACATPTQAGAASGLLNTVQQASAAVASLALD